MNHHAEPVNLLLVEDDSGHARLIERNLRRANINNPIIRFDSGKTFIDFLFNGEKSQANDVSYLVLLDLNLPGADGYEILRRLKSDPAHKKIPVVILTTTNNPGEIERCYELGCDMYISKPVDQEDFSDAMSKLAQILSTAKNQSS